MKTLSPPTPRLVLLLVLGVASLLAALRLLPYLTAEGERADEVFLGFAYSLEDSLQYADFVAQARDGAFFLSDRFSLDAEDPRLVILPLWLLGRLAAATGLPVSAVWMGIHGLLVLGFWLLLFWFLRPFLPDPRRRLAAFLFLSFAGGLDGWVALGHGLLPAVWAQQLHRDLWPVLGWTPYMAAYNPLYLAGLCALLPLLRLALAAQERPWLWLVCGAALPALYLWHSYDAVVAAAVFLLVPLQPLLLRLDARASLRRLVHALGLLPGLAATGALAAWQLGDPLFAAALAGSDSHLFVSPLVWLLGFGGVLLSAGYGARRLAEDDAHARLLFGWLLGASLLSFSPVYEGRHFLYFVSLPLFLVAFEGLGVLRARLFPRTPRWALGVLVVLVFGSSFVRVVQYDLKTAGRDDRAHAGVDELQAAEALAALPPGGVLCSRETGNWLPHRAGRRVVMGHWFLTPDLFARRAALAALLDPRTDPAERDRLLLGFGARYLFYGPRERRLGPPPRTERVSLAPLIERGRVTVYEIRPPP